MNRTVLAFILLLPILAAQPTLVEADATGPDYLAVVDVSSDETLNMRVGPSADFPKIGELPHDADGVANLGCIGGLTFADWSEASEEEREASSFKRWCLVGYDRLVGWSSGRFLTEGTHTDRFRAGQALSDMQGSVWRATWIGGRPVDDELIVRFGSDGRFGGSGGCNQLMGSFQQDRDTISVGQIATTRSLCAQDVMETEAEFIELLESAARVSAHHLVMVLLSSDSEILSQFARTDWD
ncbi:META domain-containing protein [Aliiruegeria lutimaris]|uniref:Heat shock protein HslJ n=1 Tax=Aliiruegeria lutimaris TaxID=571298 RepID=A0A1G8WWS9_9RHOB|nr:META domain-containing protein [Aliiruegeria lutimaris]SDJ82848.1 Heat shock protein HslJ [Aliiruegeria lutimaris]